MFIVLLQCLLHLKNKFTVSPSFLESILGYILVCFVVFILYFLRTIWFLMKFCKYIIDNTLMVVRIKDFMGWEFCSLLGLFWAFFFRERGQIFSIFLYFLRKFWYAFMKFCKNIFGITLTITQKVMTCCLRFARLF